MFNSGTTKSDMNIKGQKIYQQQDQNQEPLGTKHMGPVKRSGRGEHTECQVDLLSADSE